MLPPPEKRGNGVNYGDGSGRFVRLFKGLFGKKEPEPTPRRAAPTPPVTPAPEPSTATRIAMIAPTGAGKTSYLAALYGELYNVSMNGDGVLDFSFSEAKDRNRLSGHLKSLRAGVNLEPSNSLREYSLVVENGGEEHTCTLVDIPGGSIDDTLTIHEKTDEIIAELEKCDAFVVLLEASKLMAADDMQDLQMKTGVWNISHVILKALKRSNRQVPVVLAVSQIDRIKDDREMRKRGQQAIIHFLKNARNHERCIALATEVSVGTVSKGGDLRYNPMNVLESFYFALGFCRSEVVAAKIGEIIINENYFVDGKKGVILKGDHSVNANQVFS